MEEKGRGGEERGQEVREGKGRENRSERYN